MTTTTNSIPQAWRPQIVEYRDIDGRLICVQRFLLTAGLLADVTFHGPVNYDYSARYCYEQMSTALAALRVWDGCGDPPGPWIKEKRSERLGPGAIDD